MLTTAHIQRYEPWMSSWMSALGSRWGKIINPPKGFVLPGVAQSLVRVWTDPMDAAFIARGREGGRDFVRTMLPRWLENPATCYSLWNEPDCNTNVGLANLREATIGAVEEASRLGIMVGVMDLAEGNPHNNGTATEAPTIWKWQQLRPAIKAAADLGFPFLRHCYWRPGVEGPTGRWHALGRLAWDLEQLSIPNLRTLVTEYGIDGGIAGGPGETGWQKLSTDPLYRADLVEAERYARTLPGVEALMLFGVGATDTWLEGGFDVPEGFAASLVEPLRALSPSAPPSPPESSEDVPLLPMVNVHKAWYTADAYYGPYDGHPERARDWNLESGGNTDLGEPIRAPLDLSVVYAANAGGLHGIVISAVAVVRGHLINWHWKHLQRADVKAWQQVKRGQLIGTIGNAAGQYVGAHLHEEILVGAITSPTHSWKDPDLDYRDPAQWYLEHGVDPELIRRVTQRDGR